MQGRAAVPGSTSSPLHSEVIEAESEGIDHSHLILRFEHARSTHYREGLIPYCLLGKRPQGSFTGASTPESGPLIKPVVPAGVRKTVLPDSSGLPVEIAPERVERAKRSL